MEKQLVMPKLQPEMQSGVLCAWLKNEGEEIHKGEALYEIETDKVVNQIEATEDGIRGPGRFVTGVQTCALPLLNLELSILN